MTTSKEASKSSWFTAWRLCRTARREELVFDTQTSGAANDIERATELARNLVARFGMNEKLRPPRCGARW